MNGTSNNGMHPTADTTAVIYFQRLGAAGDARRWAATELLSRDEKTLFLITL